jgi:hypothetical protein
MRRVPEVTHFVSHCRQQRSTRPMTSLFAREMLPWNRTDQQIPVEAEKP